MQFLRKEWRKFTRFDSGLHERLLLKFPRVQPSLDRKLVWFVDEILSNPLFAILLALLFLILGVAGVNILVLMSAGTAWLVAFLWIARSERLKKLTILARLTVLLLGGVVLATFFWGFGSWALYRYTNKSPQVSAPSFPSSKAASQGSGQTRATKLAQAAKGSTAGGDEITPAQHTSAKAQSQEPRNPSQPPRMPRTPPTASAPPFLTLRFFRENEQPRFSIVNLGDKAGVRPKWTIALVDCTNEYYPHYANDPESSEPLPIPTNEVDDYVKGHTFLGNFAIFNQRTLQLVKARDKIFGFIGIGCMNCPRESKFWFYWEMGKGGWYAPFTPVPKGVGIFKQPNLSNDQVDRSISRIVPVQSRIEITNGKGASVDLTQP